MTSVMLRDVRVLARAVAPVVLAIVPARGAVGLERSVFARVPATGRWRTALLLDANVGIGGAPPVVREEWHVGGRRFAHLGVAP
jgi:hypothetical protein